MKIATETIIHAVDATEIFMSTTVPAKFRLAPAVIIMVKMITVVMDTEVIIETRLVLASQTIGLDLRETLICHQMSY